MTWASMLRALSQRANQKPSRPASKATTMRSILHPAFSASSRHRCSSLSNALSRFATAAEAIRFAIEELPAVRALGAWMQVGDQRFDSDDIQRLYESDDYPLQRRLSD